MNSKSHPSLSLSSSPTPELQASTRASCCVIFCPGAEPRCTLPCSANEWAHCAQSHFSCLPLVHCDMATGRHPRLTQNSSLKRWWRPEGFRCFHNLMALSHKHFTCSNTDKNSQMNFNLLLDLIYITFMTAGVKDHLTRSLK